MLWEFLLALASGLITTLIAHFLIAHFLQGNRGYTDPAIEVKARSEIIVVRKATLQDGPLVFEETESETRISELTFDLADRRRRAMPGAGTLLLALAVFLVVLLVLLLT